MPDRFDFERGILRRLVQRPLASHGCQGTFPTLTSGGRESCSPKCLRSCSATLAGPGGSADRQRSFVVCSATGLIAVLLFWRTDVP